MGDQQYSPIVADALSKMQATSDTPSLSDQEDTSSQYSPIVADALSKMNQSQGNQDTILPSPAPVTQRYGTFNPNVEVFSNGVALDTNFAADEGTPVAVPKGLWQVVKTYNQANPQGSVGDGSNDGYGNSVMVQNAQTGEKLHFIHLSKVHVNPGSLIKGGEIVGNVGSSGNATGNTLGIEYYDPNGNMGDVLNSPYANGINTQAPSGSQVGNGGGGNPFASIVGLVENGANAVKGLLPDIGKGAQTIISPLAHNSPVYAADASPTPLPGQKEWVAKMMMQDPSGSANDYNHLYTRAVTSPGGKYYSPSPTPTPDSASNIPKYLAKINNDPGVNYNSIIVNAAKENNMPASLLKGVLAHESMQFAPQYVGGYHTDGSGRGVAAIDKNAHPEITDEQAFDPHFAIPWAAKTLAAYKDQEGDWTSALRRYNGGGNYNSEQPGYAGVPVAQRTLDYANNVINQANNYGTNASDMSFGGN